MLLALGFLARRSGMIEQLGLKLDPRGNVFADQNYMTSIPGIFSAGDMRRGQSLVVWAIAEGRQAARRRGQIPHGFLRFAVTFQS